MTLRFRPDLWRCSVAAFRGRHIPCSGLSIMERGDGMTRYGMVIELNKCTGCKACMVACTNRNNTPPGVHWCNVEVAEEGVYPDLRVTNFPKACMHCKKAPCVAVCPTGASQMTDEGIVWIDYEECIGCGACIPACPYEARHEVKKIEPYEPAYGFTGKESVGYAAFKENTVTKCVFCKDWLTQGLEPACVHTCMYDARHFGDLDDPESEVSKLIAKSGAQQLLPEQGTEPSVYYVK